MCCCMYTTCFGLYVGDSPACQCKNSIKKDITESKGLLVYSHSFLITVENRILTYKIKNLRSE